MAHTIENGSIDTLKILILHGDLTSADMTQVEALGLDQRKLVLLVDASRLSFKLPPDFLDGARRSVLTHPNCLHVALYVKSDMMKNIAVMSAAMMGMSGRITVFKDYQQALKHITALAAAQK